MIVTESQGIKGRLIKQQWIIIFLLFSSKEVFSQSDHEFWFAAPPVTHQFISPGPVLYQNLNRPIRLYFTTAEGPATVTVDQPANPSFTPIIKIVNNDSARMVDLTSFIDLVETKPANSVLNTGLHITSDKRITAFYEVQSPHNAETWPLLGKNALGYEFIIPSQHHYSNYQYADPPALNTFEIVASEDSTLIKIVPRVTIVGHNAHDTVNILLNRGQTWNGSAISGDSTNHLAGSFVFSNKPVAVTISDDAVHIPSTSNNSEDIAGAQLIPRHLAGTEYAFGYATGLTQRDDIYIYAFEDVTSIVFNDSARIITRTINRGDSIDINMYWTIGGVLSNLCYIQSDKPILVYHFVSPDQVYPIGHSPQATSVIVPPLYCAGSRRVLYTMTPPRGKDPIFSSEIIVKKIYLSGFKFTPPIPGWDSTVYKVVPGTFGTMVLTGGGTWGNWPLGLKFIVTNSKGRFQFALFSRCSATDTADYAKMGYFSDFSTLFLGTDRKICPGDSTLLDAGYGPDSYLWNTGDTSQTIWVKSPGTYWVHITEEGGCNLSDTINISYYFFTPINLGPDRQICSGDSILLDAGAGRAWYDWSNGDSTQTIWVKTSGTYWVKVSDVHCPVYDTIIITTTPVPSVTNNPLSKSICSGESTNIVLTSNVPGTTFHWTATLTSGSISGYSADSGLIINQVLINSTSTPGIVTYHITPNVGSCFGTGVDFPVTVTPGDSAMISIAASANPVCQGALVTFTATPVNGGSNPSFQWNVNGFNAGVNNPVYSYIPSNGDIVKCILISSNTICISNNPATSESIIMVVNTNQPVSVSISPSSNPACSGALVTFTAAPVNGGVSPFFQWKVNGINVGSNSISYSYSPLNGDSVICVLTSSEVCTINNPFTSSPVIMVINSYLLVSVSISASANPVCSGTSVTFTATPVNGGASPSYQWKVNGNNVGINNPTYTYNPASGDLVSCILTSNLSCTTNNPATSNTINMTINSSPAVTFSKCNDTITTTNAQPFKLKGGIPLGGTYSGPGVNPATGIFNPAAAGVGNKIITYTYTNSSLCTVSTTRIFKVIAAPAFACGQALTDVRDNQTYQTVQLGTQCWMAENLNYGTMIPGSMNQRDNCINEKYCWNDLTADCGLQTYYQWDEIMQYNDTPGQQGLCPPGWHIPAEADWAQLFSVYNGPSFAASPLLSTGFSGFNAFVNGSRFQNSSWNFNGFATHFWTSTSWGPLKAWAHAMNNIPDDHSVSTYPASRADAFSVKCLKD